MHVFDDGGVAVECCGGDGAGGYFGGGGVGAAFVLWGLLVWMGAGLLTSFEGLEGEKDIP